MTNLHISFKETSNVVRNENLNIYLSQMNASKETLSDDVMRDLIAKAQNGNERARQRVINANLSLVWSIAKAYKMDIFEDVLQNGNYGLCVAVDTFDVSRGTKFSTWAVEYVRKYINIGLTDESRTVRVAKHLVYGGATYHSTSMDAPISNEDNEEKTMYDFMPSNSRADDLTDKADTITKINHLLGGLTDREKAIICGLFGFGCDEETEYTLSIRFGLTEERIRQIKWDALKKMQEMA